MTQPPKPPAIVFSRDVLPILRPSCMGCHSGPNPASGYSMDSVAKLLAGGRRGAAVVPGKGAQSNLLRYCNGELKPKMPPSGALDKVQLGVFKRWIDEGAKVDSLVAATPPLAPARRGENKEPSSLSPRSTGVRGVAVAPVTALALSPDGKTLAVGGYRVVRLLDPLTGELQRTLTGCADQVQSLSWEANGQRLAAAGGVPGESGEVAIFAIASGKIEKKLTGHTDVVVSVAWRSGTDEIATGSLDKTAALWSVGTGQRLRLLKDHADTVLAVAYSPSGEFLATASADRTAKLYRTKDGVRVAALNAHQDAIVRLAFSPDSKRLVTGSADKTVRIWSVKDGPIENPDATQYEPEVLTACAFSPDNQRLFWVSASRKIKVFAANGRDYQQEFGDATDWITSLAATADDKTLIAGTLDGKLFLWDLTTRKFLRSIESRAK
ncbi:c-type cytochrome domain-containing protein [Armatimonas sp.]|uniref:WD40 domain-containing protein n=1 Tax=Armatimonas sp. TaxID=1872638 RepID=UPI00286A61E2|nr:c-type cytochrome domain-containing protein [Armatimonas sp.]